SGNLFIAGQGSASTLDFAEGGLDLPGRSFRRGTIRDVHINASGTGQTLINLRNTDSSNWPVRWIIDNIHLTTTNKLRNTGLRIAGGWIGTVINPIIE